MICYSAKYVGHIAFSGPDNFNMFSLSREGNLQTTNTDWVNGDNPMFLLIGNEKQPSLVCTEINMEALAEAEGKV